MGFAKNQRLIRPASNKCLLLDAAVVWVWRPKVKHKQNTENILYTIWEYATSRDMICWNLEAELRSYDLCICNFTRGMGMVMFGGHGYIKLAFITPQKVTGQTKLFKTLQWVFLLQNQVYPSKIFENMVSNSFGSIPARAQGDLRAKEWSGDLSVAQAIHTYLDDFLVAVRWKFAMKKNMLDQHMGVS